MIPSLICYRVLNHAKWSLIPTSLLPSKGAFHSFSYPPIHYRCGFSCSKRGSIALRRSFSTADENPYRILNIPINSSYETVKAAFLKAALRHHPDHSKASDGAEFVRIRGAFEAIVSYQNNKNNQMNSSEQGSQSKYGWTKAEEKPPVWKSDAEFQEWFKHATGEHLSFDMNHETRQEVIHVYRTMSSGGKDKGGYWEMARQLAEREETFRRSGGRSDVTTVLGAPPTAISTSIRRKRNR
jgi:DnaJ domain